MDITSLRAGQEVSPVGRSGSGSAGIGSAILNKDGASVVDRASINTSISSGNRHIHGQGHHAANLSRLVKSVHYQNSILVNLKLCKTLKHCCNYECTLDPSLIFEYLLPLSKDFSIESRFFSGLLRLL